MNFLYKVLAKRVKSKPPLPTIRNGPPLCFQFILTGNYEHASHACHVRTLIHKVLLNNILLLCESAAFDIVVSAQYTDCSEICMCMILEILLIL